MHIQTYVGRMAAGMLAALFLGQAALATGLKLEYTEGKFLTIGGDMRVRMSSWDRDVVWPEGPPPAVGKGSNVEYVRIRTRLMLGLDLWDGAKLDARFTNRVHNVSSHWGDPNDQHPVNGRGGTWKYPDELIVDQLVLTLTDPAGIEGLTLKLGRQDFILGNGMVMLEGTPYDQGRSIYFDGLTAKYKTQCDVFTVFAFYDEYKDPYVVSDDQDRVLRRGDIFTTGFDWIHTFSEVVKTDLYYIYAKVNDDDTTLSERHFERDSNARLHTLGVRVFGSPNEWLDYSVEVAHQFGEYEENPNAGNHAEGDADAEGWFVDARLTAKFPEAMFSPKVMFEYSYFSGDDTSTTDDYEGWDPIFAEFPMYREELMAIMLNGSWTNLHIFRLETKLKLHERVDFTCAAAHLRADEGDNGRPGFGGGNGDHFGELYSAFLDIQLHERVKTKFEAAFFVPGDYWAGNEKSEWLRWETVFTF